MNDDVNGLYLAHRESRLTGLPFLLSERPHLREVDRKRTGAYPPIADVGTSPETARMAEQSKPPVNAVVRVPAVTISRTSMEATVGPLDRFEVSKVSGFSYAQIGTSGDCAWSDVLALIERVGPALLGHVERGEVGRPSIDVAFFVQEDRVTASLLVPNDVVAAIGRFGFDLEASAYLASD